MSTAAYAGSNSPVSISKDRGARGNFLHGGDTFTVSDLSKDGKSAALKFSWRKGNEGGGATIWNSRGSGTTRKMVVNVPEGATVTTQACAGNVSTQKPRNCGSTTQGTA
ncbi:hypothetical protein [Streptomyces sp. TRM68367]|uniref:hypothetical protein n=1 Tax=Streptomyces sp. TRM68367 TaxID=2758415 RepID=UPI00165AB309|nr:hypothetical protein [Streptomyces sp. TRM68367]MBC9724906.1 hypothetical protein [Streptomyces sp. TRM68367]